MRPDTLVSFTSLVEWLGWLARHPWARDGREVEAIVAHACERGICSEFFGTVASSDVTVADHNYRESLLALDLNPRLRAVLELICLQPWAADTWNARVYAPEALTRFALVLRGRFARFIGSEYIPDQARQAELFPIMHQDLSCLTFPDAVFDAVISNEVFEHVPNLPLALSEIRRVLRPGGSLLATFPFAYGQYETVIKAYYDGPTLRFSGEPEYHGNPVDPTGGSLVFQIPGWDILDVCRAQGFGAADMLFFSSVARGITGAELAGIFVMQARP